MSQTKFIPALRYHFLTPFYDKFIKVVVPEQQVKLKVLELADLGIHDKLLDFGCGTGTLLKLLAEQNTKVNAYGIDIDERMLRVARTKLQDVGTPEKIVKYAGGELPFASNFFDTVVSSWVFHHLTDEQKLEAFSQILDKLKPGGKFIVADWGKAQNLLMRMLFLILQVVDNFKTTTANVEGKLPVFISSVGFERVKTVGHQPTCLGTLAYYTAQKPL